MLTLLVNTFEISNLSDKGTAGILNIRGQFGTLSEGKVKFGIAIVFITYDFLSIFNTFENSCSDKRLQVTYTLANF